MKISLITATFNAASTLGESLKSLAVQTYPAAKIEHLIIDGASTDSTLEIVSGATTGCATRLVSEPDRGIYDALNKGIALATGDVVGILHATDLLASPRVLELVANEFKDPAVMACYGDLMYVKETSGSSQFLTQNFKVHRYWQSGTYTEHSFYWGWMPPHPTFFCRRELFARLGNYDLSLGTAADYELMLRFMLKHGLRASYIPEVLVLMRVGGASNETLTARLKANGMDRKAWKINGLKPYPWTLLCKPLLKVGQYFSNKRT